MIQILVSNPLLAIMLVLAAGAAFGQIKFGPLRFGAAGALFVGLAVGALDPKIGASLGVVQTLGLALFVYTVGLVAGSTFVRDLRTQWPLMVLGAVVLTAVAGSVTALGQSMGVTKPAIAGMYAGSLTTTPALQAAQDASGGDPWVPVGYAIGYPVGVIIAIIIVALVIGHEWPARRDTPSQAGAGVGAASVVVENPMRVVSLPGWDAGVVTASYLKHGETTTVAKPSDVLEAGDEILIVGPEAAVREAEEALGRRSERELTDFRAEVDYRRFVLSNPDLAGSTVSELKIGPRFHGRITRVQRGDLDILATDDLVLQPGDRLLAVLPKEQMRAAARYFGNSEKRISQVDALSVGLGMTLGLLLGLIPIPMIGGGTFSLGTAAGPLIAGMFLGAIHRTGRFHWDIPLAANLTIRQLGLLLFLAAVGLASGPAFASSAFTADGGKIAGLAAIVVLACALLFLVGGRLIGLLNQRVVGAFAGLVGQPAILSYATSRTADERVETGYAVLFAVGIVVKIVLVTVMVS